MSKKQLVTWRLRKVLGEPHGWNDAVVVVNLRVSFKNTVSYDKTSLKTLKMEMGTAKRLFFPKGMNFQLQGTTYVARACFYLLFNWQSI